MMSNLNVFILYLFYNFSVQIYFHYLYSLRPSVLTSNAFLTVDLYKDI